MTNTLLLIAERDSRWIEWARAWRKPQRALVVLFPQGEESHDEFCQRVKVRLETLHAHGTRLQQIVFAAGSRWDMPALVLRAQMIRVIVTKMARLLGPVKVLLDCGSKDGQAALAMAAMVAAIGDGVTQAAAQLQVVSEPASALLC